MDRSVWPVLIGVLFVLMLLDSCMDHQRMQHQRRVQQREFVASLNTPGSRVLFLDQHQQPVAKWRMRKFKGKVYDEKLRLQGHIHQLPTKKDQLPAFVARPRQGDPLELRCKRPESGGELCTLGERFEIQKHLHTWSLIQTKPSRVLVAQITIREDESSTEKEDDGVASVSIDINELKTEAGTMSRTLKSEGKPHSRVQIYSKETRLDWEAPPGVSAFMMTPFVLKNVEWTVLEQSMLALFFDALYRGESKYKLEAYTQVDKV